VAVIAKHLTIKGRVQGVFYRGWTVETARSLGLTGWVRNRMNGDVEALIEGEENAVAQFLTLAQRGPSAARVAGIEDTPAAPEDSRGFEQRATV